MLHIEAHLEATRDKFHLTAIDVTLDYIIIISCKTIVNAWSC